MTGGSRSRWICAVALMSLVVSGCQGSSATTSSATPSPGPSDASSAPEPARSLIAAPAAVLGGYERRVLADGAAALWPLGSTNTGGSGALGSSASQADLQGTIPATTKGPRLSGTEHTALAFRGTGRFVTALTAGLTAADAWTVEMWVRADGCSTTFERLAATSSLDSAGREGLDLLHYPASSPAACGYGAEVWDKGVFLGGCATRGKQVAHRWQLLAFSYSARTLSCFVGGTLVGVGHLRSLAVPPSTALGLGGAGNGYDAGLSTASLAEVAFYPRALSSKDLLPHARLLS
jgi:hypothetical protein